MKMKRKEYEELDMAIDAVVKFHGGPKKFEDGFRGNYRMLLWRLHAIVVCNGQYPDACLALTDAHVETALRRICKA